MRIHVSMVSLILTNLIFLSVEEKLAFLTTPWNIQEGITQLVHMASILSLGSHLVVIDCTSSSLLYPHYHTLLSQGISVVTPNKKGNSETPFSVFQQLVQTSFPLGATYKYETTVGAGLPLLSTLHNLRTSGDQLERIEAILSGTLSYLFNTFH